MEYPDFFERTLDNACVAGFDGYFKRLSASWSKTLGWSADELLSRPSLEFVHPDDRAATMAGRERLLTGGELGPLQNRYLCKDGGFRWFEWRSVADPERALVYCVARDITAQKQAEERLQAARKLQEELQRQLFFSERMASVGTLAAGVAHEINNPLSFVAANLTLLLEELESSRARGKAPDLEQLLVLARDAQVGAERIQKTVAALKTFSRAEDEERKAVDVRATVELSIKLAFNQIRHRARLVKELGPTPPVEGSEGRLGQVFINLLVNAAQAIPEDGGDHEIRVVTATDAEGRAVIEVRDSGPGVPPALTSRIFEPFFTTKPVGVGTGLGLSISHSIVASLGGSIGVHDGPRGGAVFRVTLPAASAAARALPAVAPEPAEPPASVRASVLVVDDEPLVGHMLRRVLASHRVTAVTTGAEALALLGAGASFDVIISDLMMPGMSGVELHQELSRRFPEQARRLVLLSGGAFSPGARAFLEQTSLPRIDKPFNPRQVRDLVRRLVAEHTARG